MSYNSSQKYISIHIQWTRALFSSVKIDKSLKQKNISCISMIRDQKDFTETQLSKKVQQQIIDLVSKGASSKNVSKFIQKNYELQQDLKMLQPKKLKILGGGCVSSSNVRKVNSNTIVKKEMSQAKQRRKRNEQSIVKADILKLNEEMEAIINTKEDDIYNGKTYVLDTILPILNKQSVVSNRPLHQKLSKILQKAINLVIRVNSQGASNDKDGKNNKQDLDKNKENNIEEKDDVEEDVDDKELDEDLVWTEKDKADMDATFTNIIDRINARISKEPLLNQLYCVTMVRNILRTKKHALKLMDEAIRYGVPLFGLVRNQDPTLLLMLAVKGLQLMDLQQTKHMVQKMMNFQLQALQCAKNLPEDLKKQSKNVQMLFAYFNALDEIISKKNKESWEVQYFCLMQINDLIKIMIDLNEVIQISNSSPHWNSFLKDEEKGMFTICQKRMSMSGIFIVNALDTFLLNHKFLRSISLDIIINLLKLIKIAESKHQQSDKNQNQKVKEEIAQVLYQRWLFETNNQIRTQFIDEDVLQSVDEVVQKKNGGKHRKSNQNQEHQQLGQQQSLKQEQLSVGAIQTEDQEERILIDFANQEQLALQEIQKQIQQQQGKCLAELEKEFNSMNETFDCMKSADGIKKVIKLRQTEIWKQSILNRREQGEIQKDDALLESINLYVNQRLQEKVFSEQEENQQKPKEVDALSFIMNSFIQKKTDLNYHTPLLSVVANGGMGKSMLFKKIEMELLDDFSKDSQQAVYERVPIIIKMADLDSENPNLISYLDNQPIFKELRLDASVLKTSELKKLILFDAFDEYKGKPFNLWTTFNLTEWKNTKVIVSSREENLSKDDYKLYFSVSEGNDQEKKNQNFLVYKLIKFGKEQLLEFAKKSFNQEQKQDTDQKRVDLLASFTQIIEENSQILKLISLPINAFIFIRTLPSLLSQNSNISIRNQTELQEIFFNYQFERDSLLQPRAGTDQGLRELYKMQFFDLFQRIAINMFKQSILSVDIYDVQIDLLPQIKKKLNSQEQKQLLQFLQDYRNPQIITLADDTGRDLYTVKFLHKSLYEYFVARAMKFDFDKLEWNNQKLIDLSFEEISKFAINSRYIMVKGKSEICILQQFARMIKPIIQKREFLQQCEKEESIQGQHNFIQIMLLTRKQFHGEKLDIASSNMLSAIANSKISLTGLKLTRCSFKKAYLYYYRGNIDFTGSNLKEAMLGQCLADYSRSKTEYAQTQDSISDWKSDSIYSFSCCVIPSNQKNNDKLSIITGSFSGFVNQYVLELNGNYSKDNNQFYVIPSKKMYEITKSKRLYKGEITNIEQFENKYFVSQKKNIIVLDENGEEIFIFQAHTQDIKFIDINYQLKHLVTCDINKQLRFWNISKQFQLISSFDEVHQEVMTSICYSQTQNILVSSSKGKKCKVWKMEGSEYVMKYEIDVGQPVDKMIFTPDGKQILVSQGFMKGLVTISLDENKSEEKQATNLTIPFASKMKFSPDNKYLAIICSNSTSIFDVNKKYEKIQTLQFNSYESSPIDIAFSSNSKYIVATGYDSSCAVWDISQDFKLVSSITGHQSSILNLSYSPDGKYIFSTSRYYIFVWQEIKLRDGSLNYEVISTISLDNYYYIEGLAFLNNQSPNHYKFSIISNASYFTLYEFNCSDNKISLIKNCNIEDQQNRQKPVALQYQKSDKYLLSATTQELNLFDVASDYTLIRQFSPNTADQKITCSCFYSDLQKDFHLLIIGYSSNTFDLWDISERSLIEKYKTVTVQGSLAKMICSPCDTILATVTSDNIIQLWHTQKDFALYTTISAVKDTIYSIAFSQDSQFLSCITEDKSIKIFSQQNNFETFKMLKHDIDTTIGCISFQPNNSQQLMTSLNNEITIWNLQETYEIDDNLQGHTESISSTCFSYDGSYLVTASSDSIMKLWYNLSAQDKSLIPLFELVSTIKLNTPNNYTVSVIVFMKDNKSFLTGCDDGSIRLWLIEQLYITPAFTIQKDQQVKAISSISIDANTNKYIAMACQKEFIRFYTQNTKQKSLEFYKQVDFEQAIHSVLFSPNNKYLAAGTNNGKVYILESEEKSDQNATFNVLCQFNDDESTEFVNNLAFTKDSKYLIAAFFSKILLVYDIENRVVTQKVTYSDICSRLEISGDGKILVLSSYKNAFYLFTCNSDSEDRKEILKYIKKNTDHSNSIFSISICQSSNLLCSGSRDSTCRLWEFSNSQNDILVKNIQTL
ncbi:WD domain, G-beta repeat protein (macronuclear) [Tetrahymena thermophila SB210]|uniref:WD domain, G-beta repeat protein n=1 Tax=Tetrahymena thermophila (strain SB210) TaxID=312017 RepID=I7MKE8_TETTS|nr:WD domain, G-beta repeat protein [Tetrahymena thermophila SB210]EAR98294.1 WD domain, G-beta repeat protein [Tetrahymena thermophila SB210]|eukprot:XP_001018539.1 WD domain, G-beta repeat protein [Tetrahymena thermophila SB210]